MIGFNFLQKGGPEMDHLFSIVISLMNSKKPTSTPYLGVAEQRIAKSPGMIKYQGFFV